MTFKNKLGVLSLTAITVGSVDSVRNLPIAALFGTELVFFFLVAAVLFLLPSALVAAELASSCEEQGGIYVWVRQAFGHEWGFLAIWFQWIQNVIWYPTILSFIASVVAYLIDPNLANNKVYLVSAILLVFWSMTLLNLRGIRVSAIFASFSALIGLLVPMTLIIFLGFLWVWKGNPIQLHWHSWRDFLPHTGQANTWVALTGIMLSYVGMEIATVHGQDVLEPKKSYPRAMLISTVVILLTLVLGSLSIAVVLPANQINLVAGVMQAFSAFFAPYHLSYLMPLMGVIFLAGALGGINNWIIAPTRGLLIAAEQGGFPVHMQRCNAKGAPYVLLIYQGVVVSILSLIFLFEPTVNASYWILTALSVQLYMLMYILMFVAAVKLRYLPIQRQDGFIIPGPRHSGMWVTAFLGLLGALVTIAVGFIAPDNIDVGSHQNYVFLLLVGLLFFSIPPFLFSKLLRSKK